MMHKSKQTPIKLRKTFRVGNVTFFYDKPPIADILILKKQVRNEGYDELENAEFMSRIIERYVTVRKGFLAQKVTAGFLQPYSKIFKEKFFNELTKNLI